jgi:hypothetical protein
LQTWVKVNWFLVTVIISLLNGGIIPLLMPSYKSAFCKIKAFFSYYAKIMAGSALPPAIWLRITWVAENIATRIF